MANQTEEKQNILNNGNFEAGLLGWIAQGEVRVVVKAADRSQAGVQIGPGGGAVRQRYPMKSLRIIYFGANLLPDPVSGGGVVRVECYDKTDRRVMDLRQELDPKKVTAKGVEVGLYFKTHGRTASIVVSIERESSAPGTLLANSAKLVDYSGEKISHRPQCDLDQYMEPFWKGDTVYDETVLLFSEGGKPASGRLMYKPRRILSVRDYAHTNNYQVGRDYTLAGNVLTATVGSNIPRLRDRDLEAGDIKWYNLAGKHIVVTYTHDDLWQGPRAMYQGQELPRTMDRLVRRLPLTIVATGDSITQGTGTSGETGISPYMPTWAELFTHGLKQRYGYTNITLFNTALGGMTSDWGRETAPSAVASLNPDLVLIAFGMNDFWWMPADQFRQNTQDMIQAVRAKNPTAEFILIASMRFDPAYAKDPEYRARMASYTPTLRSLVGKGVQLLDMDTLSGVLAEAKKPKDLISDPLHPNDFLARWYAQGLVALLDKEGTTPDPRPQATSRVRSQAKSAPQMVPSRSSSKKGLGIYPEMLAYDPARRLRLGWYYNWVQKPLAQVPREVEFVPMVFGWYGDKDGSVSKEIATLRQALGARYLLGYNEPDGSDQAKLTPAQALDTWPILMKANLPLGSPAATHADAEWMREFMAGVVKRGYRVDFVTIHWYYLTQPDSFFGYIEKVYKLYRKPIWITEFANVDWESGPGKPVQFTPNDVAEFLKVVLPRLDKLDYVQRYAWFTADGPYATAALFDTDGSLTEAGKVYAAH